MDTSINQQDTQASREILKRLVCTPGHIVTEDDLHATGVDVDLLESMYELNIKPYLDYLHGYDRLEALDPLSRHRPLLEGASQQYPPELHSWNRAYNGKDDVFLWYSLLAHCGMLGQRTQAKVVKEIQLYSPRFPATPTVTVAFYLARSGKWLLWFVEGSKWGGGTFRNERLSAHNTVREAWEAFRELVPDDYIAAAHHGPVQHLPLLIEQSLRGILETTIKEKERRLGTLKESLASAKRRINIVHQ